MADKLAAVGILDIEQGVRRIRCITCKAECTLVQATERLVAPFANGVCLGFVCCGPEKHMTYVTVEERVGYSPVLRVGVKP